MKQVVALISIKSTPLYLIEGLLEGYTGINIGCVVLYREHSHFDEDVVSGMSWHTGLMQQGLLADAYYSGCQ